MTFQTLITPEELARHPGFRIFDCRQNLAEPDRGLQEYLEGHLPGAMYAHLDKNLSSKKTGTNGRHPLPEAKDFMAWLGSQGIRPDDQIVVYDAADGMFAARLWWLLRWVCHTRVAVLDGGLARWIAEGRPITTERPAFEETATYPGRPNPDMVVSAEIVEANLKTQFLTIVDARSAERYAGRNETIDRIGGHIPGALNRPFTENLVDGRFKDNAVLRKEFETVLADIRPDTIVNQCGSGVTACHNMLAMEIAGLHGSRLYPGSWSEWSSDVTRPVSTKAPRTALFIDGRWTEAKGRKTIPVYNPSTENVINRIAAGNVQDAQRAVAAAKAAFDGWSRTTPEERAGFLRKIHEGLQHRAGELASTIAEEIGMPLKLTERIQVGLPIGTFGMYAEMASEFSFESKVGNSLVIREPVGVVVCITPWNYPLHQTAAKVAAALAAGCTVVLKPSQVTPLNAFLLAEIMESAGLPPGVFNLVSGNGKDIGESLVSDPRVDMVSFTGSTQAGVRVSTAAAPGVKRVALELGGKSASIILDDADFSRAIKSTVNNCFLNSGQTCTAHTRMLVPESRYAEAVELAVQATQGFTLGDPFDPTSKLGPVVSSEQREIIRSYIRKGIEEGAELLCGGPEAPDGMTVGYYVKPTIFGRVDPDSTIGQEEIFGPVLCIMTYTDEDDAVRIANNSIYGLAGAVWSESDARAIAIARRLRTGQVDINGGTFNPRAPFGGYKHSGNGRELGVYGLEEFLEYKSMQLRSSQ